jgi:predicted PurR-regulated permease PerM
MWWEKCRCFDLASIQASRAAPSLRVRRAFVARDREVGDPILWGTVAFLLNYVPILGTALGVLIFLLAGLLTTETLWQALLPAGLYLGLHLIEGETVTPMLLTRRFTLNPVLVITSLVFWFWMWGIPGVIVSVPMLAIAKIICDRVRPLAAFGHFLEG